MLTPSVPNATVVDFMEKSCMRSILRSDLMIIKTPQNVHKICFRGILVTFTCEVKFDLIKFEPHYVKFFFFSNLLHSQGV